MIRWGLAGSVGQIERVCFDAIENYIFSFSPYLLYLMCLIESIKSCIPDMRILLAQFRRNHVFDRLVRLRDEIDGL